MRSVNPDRGSIKWSRLRLPSVAVPGARLALGMFVAVAGLAGWKGMSAALRKSDPPPAAPTAFRTLPQEVYVWQRAWGRPVIEALDRSRATMDGWVILGGELGWRKGGREWIEVPLDFAALRALGRPVGLCVRCGPVPPSGHGREPHRSLPGLTAGLLSRASENGVSVAEIQIDYDCPARRLDEYAALVQAIRERAGGTRLTITALPTWLKHAGFESLVRRVDGFVLQVHSVERPGSWDAPFTLCDPEAARKAVVAADRLGVPFRVALPTYGYRMAFDAKGRWIGLTADGPERSWPPGTRLREVHANPTELAALVRAWQARPPAHLTGLIWYRLPVDSDSRNWPWATFCSVIRGGDPVASVEALLRRGPGPVVDVMIANRGDATFDGGLSLVATWSGATLEACDGLAGFEGVDEASQSIRWRSARARLKPGEERRVAWLRLDEPPGSDLAVAIEESAGARRKLTILEEGP